MITNTDLKTVSPFPRERLLMADGGRLGLKKHTVHGLVEFDITAARQSLRQQKTQTGEAISFSAFFLACLGKAIEQNKAMHAYRNWRNQLVAFDEVDVNMLFEVEIDGQKTIRPHIIRGVNQKSAAEIQHEIRAFQENHQESTELKFIEWFVRLPGMIRRLCLRILLKKPAACEGLLRNRAGDLNWNVWHRGWLGSPGSQPHPPTHSGRDREKTGSSQ